MNKINLFFNFWLRQPIESRKIARVSFKLNLIIIWREESDHLADNFIIKPRILKKTFASFFSKSSFLCT